MPFYYGLESPITFFLVLAGLAITLIAQFFITNTYNRFKRVKTKKSLSGLEVAKMILLKHNLEDIHVVETKGNLTDHYDPKRKVVRLSSEIYNGDSIASSSIAAHEVGHAIQDKEGYLYMRFRSGIFPIVNLINKLGYISILIGIIFGYTEIIFIGIIGLVLLLIFQIITLPVEFNASKRARDELFALGILDDSELRYSKDMLTAAALTYVAGVLTTSLEILRLVLISRNRK